MPLQNPHVQISDPDHVARTAKTYANIGNAHGHSGSYAEKVGKRPSMAANDNPSVIIKKIAA